jgi:hypothetical protein
MQKIVPKCKYRNQIYRRNAEHIKRKKKIKNETRKWRTKKRKKTEIKRCFLCVMHFTLQKCIKIHTFLLHPQTSKIRYFPVSKHLDHYIYLVLTRPKSKDRLFTAQWKQLLTSEASDVTITYLKKEENSVMKLLQFSLKYTEAVLTLNYHVTKIQPVLN